ncbi:MAG TPA: DNA-3-methyladenine glycosylase 2 family protein [Nocardioides sp.]|nr:DNA-3-methyladenine glycosylase 2 family protein [Nocardioides sp.]
MTEHARTWRPEWPCPVGRILGQSRRGAGDPTYRIDGSRHWRGLRTPEGPTSLLVEPRPAESVVAAHAWGPGAAWALDSLPGLLGADDDPTGFEPRLPLLEQAQRHHPHWRLGRTGLVLEALVPAIIEQKVTGQEAFAGFRRLVKRYGEPAPGPGADAGLWVQPTPEALRTIPSWEWLRLHIDPARSRPLVRAAVVAGSLERLAALPGEEADRRLRSLPGVGRWTSAEVRTRALGDADAVSFGDYHVAADVGWAVRRTPMDDDELEEFLEPWRPHRGRVVALIALTGLRRPRRGPRMAPRSHLPAG